MTAPAHASVAGDLDFAPPSFAGMLRRRGLAPLRRAAVETLQVNLGKLCNQACHHCHVEAGPKRTEVMTRATAERVIEVLSSSPGVATVDVTGGAPELNPHFAYLVENARRLGRRVIDRCNLTVLFEPAMEWLPELLVHHRVEIVCSLPCYSAGNVDRQRGQGVFEKSIEALRRLNRLGYGKPSSPLVLNLVYNPQGASLPPPESALEADYKYQLRARFGIEFHRLFAITNMPIKRFAAELARSGRHGEYMSLLVNHFNPAAVDRVMCRSLVSVGWDGALYDCDFNQMLEMPIAGRPATLAGVSSLEEFVGVPIATAGHCFGCTAGAGSSCGGEIVGSRQ